MIEGLPYFRDVGRSGSVLVGPRAVALSGGRLIASVLPTPYLDPYMWNLFLVANHKIDPPIKGTTTFQGLGKP